MESKTERQSGNERLSWHELNSYTTAKLALRQINEALSHADSSNGKNEILRTAGEFVTETVDAIAGKTDGDYSKLLDKATNIGVKIVNSGLIGEATQERDHEILEIANYVGLLGMRLAEKKMDLESEGLPTSFVKFKAVDYTIGRFKEAAKINPAWNRRISGQEFMDGFGKAAELAKDPKNQNMMKENITKARYAGSIDFRNGVAQVTSSALTHVNAGLADEKDETKIGLHERSAKLVMSMYDAIVSDDALYTSKKLFEDEREAFQSGVTGPNTKNMYWEMDSLLGKLDTYEKLVDEAKSVVNDIARNELIANGENDTRPVDAYLMINTDKIKNFGQEMLGSVTVLFENTFAPAAQSYAKLDEEKAKKCMDAEKRVADKLVELSTLYQAWGAVFQHGNGKRVGEAEFETYHSMVKQQIGKRGA